MMATTIFMRRRPFRAEEPCSGEVRGYHTTFRGPAGKEGTNMVFGVFAAGAVLEVAPWSALPFAALLLAIALLPVFAGHFWEFNRNKALVAAAASLPVLAYLLARDAATEGAALAALANELRQYASFILLLGSLY